MTDGFWAEAPQEARERKKPHRADIGFSKVLPRVLTLLDENRYEDALQLIHLASADEGQRRMPAYVRAMRLQARAQESVHDARLQAKWRRRRELVEQQKALVAALTPPQDEKPNGAA
jgi:hypothetical protein